MFSGVYTALVTPFSSDGRIDDGRMRALVDAQIDAGIDGLVPVGTTGESPTVTHDENIRIVEIVAKQAADRVPVIAGTGSNSTAEAVDMTLRAKDVGATATLQVTPYYNKPNQEGLYRHFIEIAEAAELPVIVYNIPGRTGRNIENDTMLRLAVHPGIAAVKEASGSIAQIMDLICRKPDSFDVLAGDDNFAFPTVTAGGTGVISVASNALPREMKRMVSAALTGDTVAARNEHYRLLPFFQGLFLDTNPIPIKYAMARLGMIEEIYRLPLVELAEDQKRRLDEIMTDLQLPLK